MLITVQSFAAIGRRSSEIMWLVILALICPIATAQHGADNKIAGVCLSVCLCVCHRSCGRNFK